MLWSWKKYSALEYISQLKEQYTKCLLVCDDLPQSLFLIRNVLFAAMSVSTKFLPILGECGIYLEETFALESYTLVVCHKDSSRLFVVVKLKASKTLETATVVS